MRLQLLHRLKGRTVTAVIVHHPKSVDHNAEFSTLVTDKVIEHIDRIGKLMIFSFADTPDFFLLTHLKMTGQFLFLDPSGNVGGGGHSLSPTDTHLPNRHTRISFTLDNGMQLFFNDMRLFGYVKIADTAEVEAVRSKFGPEPITDDFDIDYFIKGLSLCNLDKPAEAEAAYTKAIEFEPGFFLLYFLLAAWRKKQGNINFAMADLNMIKTSPLAKPL